MKERLEMAETQLEEAAQLNMSISGDRSLTGEVVDLQAANVELVTERQALQMEVGKLKAEVEGAKAEARREAAKAEVLAREVEEVQAEVVGYSRQVEAAREEVGITKDFINHTVFNIMFSFSLSVSWQLFNR